MKLENKVAIVTGSSRGIGRAIALGLAKEGACVVVNYCNSRKAGEEVAHQIEKMGFRSIVIKADVSKEDEVEKMVKTTINEFNKIDILVNNAGICPFNSIADISLDEWNKVLSVNLTGVFICSKAVMRFMIQKRSGKIINISSTAGKTGGIVVSAHYSASKAAVISLTKSLAKELSQYGINVNAVAPGGINTDIWTKLLIGSKAKLLNTIPLGRFGEPEDVAKAVVFLASDAARYITGEILDINGGMLMD